MRTFSDFLGKRKRETKQHLKILEQIFKKVGFQCSDHLEEREDPYIFIRKPLDSDPALEALSFGGVRIYSRGKDIMCYRVANKEASEPYGNAYQLDIKGIFKELIQETHKKEKIGIEMVRYIVKELKDFFLQSAKAEKDGDPKITDGKMGAVTNAGTQDFANMSSDPRNSRT